MKFSKKVFSYLESGWISPNGDFYNNEDPPFHTNIEDGWIQIKYDSSLFFINILLFKWEQPSITSIIEYLKKFKDQYYLHLYIEDLNHKTIFDGQIGDFIRHESIGSSVFKKN